MKLKVLTAEDCEQVRLWRNESLVSLRTPFLLTKEQQQKFYDEVICNRNARARYWGIWTEKEDFCNMHCPYKKTRCNECRIASEKCDNKFIGMCGLENIEYENGNAEISIIINPEYHGKGYGEQAIDLLLQQGFDHLRLELIFGECYTSNPAKRFWEKIIEKYHGEKCFLRKGKQWGGGIFKTMYFDISKEDWKCCK